jgi:hypothetical protein
MNTRTNTYLSCLAAVGVLLFVVLELRMKYLIRTERTMWEKRRENVPAAFGIDELTNYVDQLDLFLGIWEPIGPSLGYMDEPICPTYAKDHEKFLCDFGHDRSDEAYKKYVAPGLREIKGQYFIDSLQGPIAFVGDSLSEQMNNELLCLLEYQGVTLVDPENPPFFWIRNLLGSELGQDLSELLHVRIEEQSFDANWIDQVVQMEASYIVFNTGAWWNPYFFRWKKDWCDYPTWPELSLQDILMVYELTLRQSVLPKLKKLWKEHGIRTIWRDVAPAGFVDDLKITSDFPYHTLFPEFNKIARQVIIEADGWLLPIWHLSYLRQDDHKLGPNNDTVHWCAFHSPETVPGVWNHLLYTLIMKDTANAASLQQTMNQPAATAKPPGSTYWALRNSPAQRNRERIAYLYNELKQRSSQYEISNPKNCSCGTASSYLHCTANFEKCVWIDNICQNRN